MSFPRDIGCDSDGCKFDSDLNCWVHVEGCNPATGLTREEILRRLDSAPPGSFLDTTLRVPLMRSMRMEEQRRHQSGEVTE